jgi:hypothetical protein
MLKRVLNKTLILHVTRIPIVFAYSELAWYGVILEQLKHLITAFATTPVVYAYIWFGWVESPNNDVLPPVARLLRS